MAKYFNICQAALDYVLKNENIFKKKINSSSNIYFIKDILFPFLNLHTDVDSCQSKAGKSQR